jgi:hypothetical protein
MSNPPLKFVLIIAALHVASGFLLAQLPTARLLTIFPPGCKVGSTSEVTVAGIDLEDARGIYFSHSNITATAQTNGAGKFLISIGTNVTPGTYDARVIGRYGISNPRKFVVGELDENIEQAKESVEGAMEIAVGTTVNGRAEASTAHYAFQATSGQRIAIECQAGSIDSRMDPSLILYGPQGRELKQCRRGGALDFVAAENGRYVVKVHDFLFGSGSEYFYRLTLRIKPSQTHPETTATNEPEDVKSPCEIAGQFYPAGEVDRYKFDV